MTKEDLMHILGRPIAFQRPLVRFGGVTGALMLSQLIYWSGKEKSGDGWIYKTQVDLEEETGLTRYEQETARKRLVKLEVLEEKLEGLPARLYFKINFNTLWMQLCKEDESVGIQQSSLLDSSKQGCGNPTNKDAGTQHATNSTENTAGTTFSSSTPSRGAAAERKKPEKRGKSGQQWPMHLAGIECWTDQDLVVAQLLVEQHGEAKVALAARGCGRPLPTAVRKALAPAGGPAKAKFDPYEFMRRTSGTKASVIEGVAKKLED